MTPRRLRWTVLASHVPPEGGLGGIVRYTTELLVALSQRDDIELTAVTTPASSHVLRAALGDRGRVVTVPSAPTSLLSIGERFSSRFVGPVGDVVHGAKHLLPRRSKALRVLTVHDMLLLDRPNDFGSGKRVLLPPIYRASIADADLLVCVSAATRSRLLAHAPQAADRAEVVHLATSSELRAAIPTPLTQLFGRRFALVVGDPTQRKNLRTVLTAWEQVREQVPDAVLAVAGPPSWGRTDIGSTWDSLVDSGAVAALGRIDDAQLRWAYEHAALVMCPSLAEGFGLPAAEALDFGAPVAISEDAALQEVCAGRARDVLPALDVTAWAGVAVDALREPVERPRTDPTASSRTWDEVADETVLAVRRRLATR